MEKQGNGIKILVADGDRSVHEALAEVFEFESYQMLSAFDGEDALQIAQHVQLNAVVLDVNLPKMDGLQLCREIRKFSNVPIVVLSAKCEEFDRLLGLELGADDYMAKPYSPREVVARIKAILRRMGETNPSQKVTMINVANLEIDMSAYQVKLDGEIIPCTPKEIEILNLLASNPGVMFSREHLLQSIWGYDYLGDTRAVDSHIKRIRSKFCREGNGWEIRTVWGIGYRLEVIKDDDVA